MNSIYLGLNIDHVATLRQARGTAYPDPIKAALDAEMAGADSITLHLREDRRHIQDEDVARLSAMRQTKINLEMAATQEMVQIALKFKPEDVCLVPERREELTTEGGLDVAGQQGWLSQVCAELATANCRVSLFIDPDTAQIDAAKSVGAPVIELHTGTYAKYTEQNKATEIAAELQRISQAASYAKSIGLTVNAGHGLHYHNVQAIAAMQEIEELNIGHAIIAQAVFSGLPNAVKEMKRIMVEARMQSYLK